MKQIKAWAIGGVMLLIGVLGVVALTTAPDAVACTGVNCVTTGASKADTGGGSNVNTFIRRIVNILLFVLGAIAVIMIVLGGIKFTTSNGNAEQIKSAKNTILYSVIGLVVAILAYAIVNFVVQQITGQITASP